MKTDPVALLEEARDSMNGLASVIRQLGTCAPSALESVASKVDAAIALMRAPVVDGVVAWIAPSALESLRICRNDDHNGFVQVWMRADDERTIPLYTRPQDVSGKNAGRLTIPEAVAVSPDGLMCGSGFVAKGDYAINGGCSVRIVNSEFARGWNEARAAMQQTTKEN